MSYNMPLVVAPHSLAWRAKKQNFLIFTCTFTCKTGLELRYALYVKIVNWKKYSYMGNPA
jgi:hypothetical protein